MNEHTLHAVPIEPVVPSASHKDRSAGLVVFGVFNILLGCLAGLFVGLILFLALCGPVPSVPRGAPNPPVPVASLLLGGGMYGVLAVALIWLGIGSIMARRWARALLLIFSWVWLVGGVIAMIVLAMVLPGVLANASARASQPAMPGGVLVFVFIIYGIIFVVLPAIWTFFYSSRHVKATCEIRDLTTRWTDGCPLPVLGFCLYLAFSALAMLAMPLAMHGVFPFFGMLLTGMPGGLVYLAIAGLWAGCAVKLYKLEKRGWWVVLIAMGLFLLSALLTYAFHDVWEIYRLAGMPDAQIEQIRQMDVFTGNRMEWFTALVMLPFFGYLLFIKRFMRGNA